MRKIVLGFVMALSLLCLSSCEYIPDYKFSTTIPQDYIAGKYFFTQTEDPEQSRVIVILKSDTSFKFEGADSDVAGLLPSNGVYEVRYSTFSVTGASGKIVFSDLDNDVKVSVDFIWSATAEDGPLSLYLAFPDNARFTLTYGGKG